MFKKKKQKSKKGKKLMIKKSSEKSGKTVKAKLVNNSINRINFNFKKKKEPYKTSSKRSKKKNIFRGKN